MKKTDIVEIVFFFVSLAVAALVGLSVIFSFIGHDKSFDGPEESDKLVTESFERGWANRYGLMIDITKLHQRTDMSTENALVLTNIVPENDTGGIILFRVNNLIVNVYIDDRCVLYSGENGKSAEMTSFQTYRVVRVRPSDSGKEIRMEIFSTPFTAGSCIDNVYFGDPVTLISNIVSGGLHTLIVSVITFVVGIIFICVGIFTKKLMTHSRGMLFFGVFSVMISMWFISGSVWVMALTDKLEAVDASSYLYLVTAVMFGLMYVYDMFKIVHALIYKTLYCLWVGLIIFMIAAMLSGIMQPGEFINVILIFMLLAFTIVLVELISYLVYNHGNKEKGKYLHFGVIAFVVFGLYDLCRYFQGNNGDSSAATRNGIIILAITVAIYEIHETVQLLSLGIKAGKIGKIAYTDANTGIGNVAAFKEKMDTLEITKTNYNYIGIIQFDVNNLKIVNDTKGHEAGDYLIKSAANVINRSFGTIGTCYRTGGDEFVAITTYNHAPIACQDAIIKFNSLIDQFNNDRTRPFDLRIAYGVAYYESAKNPYISLKEIHKIADERMYNNKKELKARYARTPEEAEIR